MKRARFASVTVLVVALAAIVLFSARYAAGQNAPGASVPEKVPILQELIPPQSSRAEPLSYGGQNPYLLNFDRNEAPDPEIRKLQNDEALLDRETAGIVKDYTKTENEAQRDKIKTKLADVLAKEFDLQQKRREIELARLETHMKKLRDMMAKRSAARRTIVEQRLDQLLREAEGLGWNAPAKGAPYPGSAGNMSPFGQVIRIP